MKLGSLFDGSGGFPLAGTIVERSAGRSDRVKCLNPWDSQSIRQYDVNGIAPNINANSHGGQNRWGVCYPAAFMGGQGAKARSIAYCDDGSTPTLKAAPSGGNTVQDVVYCLYDARGNGDGKVVPTMTGDHDNRITDYTSVVVARCRSMGEYAMDNASSTLKARDYKGGTVDLVIKEKSPRKYVVRRLTPTECARLQGFPDWWTDGVDGSDSARYKLWGNGIALPCAEDVIGRIVRAMEVKSDG